MCVHRLGLLVTAGCFGSCPQPDQGARVSDSLCDAAGPSQQLAGSSEPGESEPGSGAVRDVPLSTSACSPGKEIHMGGVGQLKITIP